MAKTYFMRFPEGKAKSLTLSYDDGVQQDVRLIEIMNKHGLKGTFNINSGSFAEEGTVYPEGTVHRRMSKSECLKAYQNSGQEVAAHAVTHPFLNKLSVPSAVYEIIEDRRALEDMFGCLIRGGAYPFGAYNDDVVNALRMCGIEYFRTVKSTESFDIPEDWVLLHPTCHHKHPKLNEFADKFINETPCHPWCPEPWLFYLWGHAYEFDGDNNWNVIEEFAEKIGGKEDIWYATNIEVVEYHKAYKSLIFSADMKIVKNPTCIDVWICDRHQNAHKIPAGETVTL